MIMIYMKLLLFCLLIATTVAQGHRHHRRDRRRRLQKERYVCTIDDTEHCQDPTESYMISCSMDTCAWATDELKSDKWPSECDTLYVSQEEIDQQIVPDWWEPCLLWVQMFGPPPPPQTDTESPTDSPTAPPTDSPTASPTSAPSVVPPPPTLAPSSETDLTITSGPTVDLNPVGNETVPVGNETVPVGNETVPAPPTGNETTPGGGTPPVNQTKPDDGGESNNSTNTTTPTTSTSTTVDLETLLLTYIFTPETTRRRLQVKLPIAVILNRTTEFLLVTMRTTLPVTDLTLELVITQTLQWQNKTELVATALSGQVVLTEETADDQVKSEIYGIVNEAFENDAPEYVKFLQLSQDDAPALNQLYAVKSGMLPSEFEAEGGTDNNTPAAAISSEESSWYQEPYFPAVIAGATCLFLAVLIGFIVMHRNRNRPKRKSSKRVAGTVPQTMTNETGQMESDEHNYDNYDINEEDDDDDDELVSVLFDAANEAHPAKSLD